MVPRWVLEATYAGRGAKAGAGALLNKFMGGPETLKGIAVGKVLEEATGVTSVFVTNCLCCFLWVALAGQICRTVPTPARLKASQADFRRPMGCPLGVGCDCHSGPVAQVRQQQMSRLDAAQRSKLLN